MSAFLKRWWWALLAVAVCLGFWRLRFNADILDLLPPDEPTVRGLKLYEQHFSNARELIITLRASEPAQADQLAEALAKRLRQETNLIEEVTWQPPWMETPEQLGELLGWLWFNQPPQDFATLTNRLAPGQLKPVLDETKEILATSMSPLDLARRSFDPYNLLTMPALTNFSGMSMDQSQQMFASADGKYRLLYVQSAVELANYRSCASWLKSIRAIVAEVQAKQPKPAVIRYTGRPVFVEEIATSMQRDMSGSVVGTSIIIGLLFWLTHRRWLPMLWLLTLLGLVLMATLALGGLVLGTVSVVSLGFAAVLLGLAVDYAVVHYQEALAHPQLTVPEIRRAIAPSILWAAITTICAFLVLNLGGLPGLGQLGTLVGLGVGVAALVMVMIYLPPLFPGRRQPRPDQPKFPWWSYFVAPHEPPVASVATPSFHRGPLLVTGLILATAGAVVWHHRPGLDRTGNALRPQRSAAEAALEEMTAEFGLPKQPLWVILDGRNEADVYQRFGVVKDLLDGGVTNRLIGRYLLPDVLWPRAEFQTGNRATAMVLGRQGPVLRSTALENGFNTNALVLTEELVQTWSRAGASTTTIWPTNHVSQWLLKRFVARSPNDCLVMGLVYPATNQVEDAAMTRLSTRLARNGAFLSGWELLGSATLKRVQAKMWQVVTPMVLLVVLSLWLAFRRPTEILLGLAALSLAGLCLLATMTLAGWTWNLMNLMAVPLMLGTGVDYTLFIQLALRRHGGDLAVVRRSVGRALMLCGGTAVAGFGSLGFSGNLGMASLGKVCAVGIGANTLISIFLLPAWWRLFNRNSYRAGLWRLGMFVARVLPAGLVKAIAARLADVYWLVQRRRCAVLVRNFLPVFAGDRQAAEKAARAAHRNFAAKLVDLWQVEGGNRRCRWLTTDGELEIIHAARRRKCGTLYITLHLGNWEHGGLLLNELGIPLTILTQTEPDDGLTDLRRAARARYGVETLIIGNDSFAFVEVIKQLQAGADLAISLDRPPDRGGVPVEFFGKAFEATLAAAELARASGCALIGVTIVRRPEGYAVKVLPEFVYDRKALGNREARTALTQQILRAFEPEIRKDIEQWYQFTPIWPAGQ